MWNKKTYDFGIKPSGIKITAKFIYEGDKKIKAVKPSCGCTASSVKENTVTLVYTTGTIPPHLKKKGEMRVSKPATVIFEDDSEEIISIVGTVKSK